MLRYLCLLLCSFGLYSTSVNALVEYNPIHQKYQQVKNYAKTINQVATVVMGYYADLLKHQSSYAGNYPKNIKALQIIGAELSEVSNDSEPQSQTTFTLTAQLSYLEQQKLKTQQIQEAFIFKLNQNGALNQVERLQQAPNAKIVDFEFNANHYLNRQFAYSWLLLLDGHNAAHLNIFDDSNANYQIVIGANRFSGHAREALEKRKNWMGSGGHLLRSVNVIKALDNNLQLELIIDWKGIATNNKWRIAKIKQVIDIQKSDQAIYKITNINEQHLLPDIAPWEKILC
jgi:hypothetical protein